MEKYFEEKYKDLEFCFKESDKETVLTILKIIYMDGYDKAMEYHKEGD